jgi:hypothetical protein
VVTAVAAAIAVSLAPVLTTAAHADDVVAKPISRSEVIARAHFWLTKNVQYSQEASYPDPEGRNYRTDCSGFASMAWHLEKSYTTATLDDVSEPISRSELKPGDILLKRVNGAGHAVVFEKWTNEEHTLANFIAESSPANDMNYYQNKSPGIWGSEYKAFKYKKIFDDSYSASNETAKQSTAGAKCNTSKPSDPTIDIGGMRDVYIEAEVCARYELSGAGYPQVHAWITVNWQPGKDADDSSDTSKNPFDGFLVHAQLQQDNVTKREVHCYFDNNINASYTGSASCNVIIGTTTDAGNWGADGFINWDINGDGKQWQKPWYVLGSPAV